MALDQLKAFLKKMEVEPTLKNEVIISASADDVVRIALKLGDELEFSSCL